MENSTAKQLLDLNRQFYQTFAQQFSATRMRLQPGVKKILAGVAQNACILDIGCGNGEFPQALENARFQGQYIGCDFSAGLLNIAKSRFSGNVDIPPDRYQFFQLDIAHPDWQKIIPHLPYDLVLSFAVLHHLPGMELRLRLLSSLKQMLSDKSQNRPVFIHSVWQFMNSPRLRARIQPWKKIGIKDEDIDPGDFLLDWRQGGQGLRYVHLFSESELQVLANTAGFTIKRTFYSDGEGGKLGLYQIWETMRV